MELQLILLEYYWWILIKILSRKEKIDIQDIGQMRDRVLAQWRKSKLFNRVFFRNRKTDHGTLQIRGRRYKWCKYQRLHWKIERI